MVLTKIGEDHHSRSLKGEHFEVRAFPEAKYTSMYYMGIFQALKETIMVLLDQVLKKKFSPVVKESWDLALTVVMQVVKNAMAKMENQQNKQVNDGNHLALGKNGH